MCLSLQCLSNSLWRFELSRSVKRALNCAISGPHLRNAAEYGVSTHIWANFYTNSMNLGWYMCTCENWPTCEYSHHAQRRSLSGGLKLRNLMLATRVKIMIVRWLHFCLNQNMMACACCNKPWWKRNCMLPKRRFWKNEQKMKSGFSKHFSTICSPNRVLTHLKSASKSRISSFVPPSKIFVWEG